MRRCFVALAVMFLICSCTQSTERQPNLADHLQELRAQCQQASALWAQVESYARQLPKHPERHFLAWSEKDKSAWSMIASRANYLVHQLQMATPQNPRVPYRNPKGITEESVRAVKWHIETIEEQLTFLRQENYQQPHLAEFREHYDQALALTNRLIADPVMVFLAGGL